MASNKSVTKDEKGNAVGKSGVPAMPYAPPTANASWDDVKDELSVEFIKARELAECGPFNIIGVSRRAAIGRFPDQVNFEVQFLEGKSAGATAVVSLKDTAMRSRLARVLEKRGSIGPLVLTQAATAAAGNSPAWIFVSPEAAAAGHVPTDADYRELQNEAE